MILDRPIQKWFVTSKGKDSNFKSFIKSISWRIVGTLDTMVISFLVTGQLIMAISIGSIEVVTKIILYYLHERAWETITKTQNDDAKNEFA